MWGLNYLIHVNDLERCSLRAIMGINYISLSSLSGPSSLSCEFDEGTAHMSFIPPCPALSIMFPNACSPLPCKRISHPSPLPVTRSAFPREHRAWSRDLFWPMRYEWKWQWASSKKKVQEALHDLTSNLPTSAMRTACPRQRFFLYPRSQKTEHTLEQKHNHSWPATSI